MKYKINEVFEKGQKRYYVNGYYGAFSSGPASEIGPFIYKRSAVKCLKMKKLNEKIMCLVQKHPGLDDGDHEVIFETLELAIDRVDE